MADGDGDTGVPGVTDGVDAGLLGLDGGGWEGVDEGGGWEGVEEGPGSDMGPPGLVTEDGRMLVGIEVGEREDMIECEREIKQKDKEMKGYK